jgi:hypothetical protein
MPRTSTHTLADIGFKFDWSEPLNSEGAEEVVEASVSPSLLLSPVPSAFLEVVAPAFLMVRWETCSVAADWV